MALRCLRQVASTCQVWRNASPARPALLSAAFARALKHSAGESPSGAETGCVTSARRTQGARGCVVVDSCFTEIRVALPLRYVLACSALAVVLASCSTLTQWLRMDEHEPPNGMPRIEVDHVRYDGRDLAGRLLVTAVDGGINIDRRFIENAAVTVRETYDCDTGRPVEFLLIDSFPPPPGGQDLILVTPGKWYGAEVSFSLFDERLNQQDGPACVRASIDLLVYRGADRSTERFRFDMTARKESPDGGGADAGVEVDAGVR